MIHQLNSVFTFLSLGIPLPSNFACERDDLEMTCPFGKVIEVISGNYGRRVSSYVIVIDLSISK